jgi:hypothetical protein
MMPLDFVPLWTLILGFGVFMYVLMDGFDLGVGILFRRAPNDAAREIMAGLGSGRRVGTGVGGALGLGIEHSFFFIVVQIMAVHERRYSNRDRSDAASTRAWPQYPKFDSLACQFVIDCAFLLAR